MKVGYNKRKNGIGNVLEADIVCSGTLGERAEHYQRATDAGTPEPSLPLQSAVQLSGYRVLVSFHISSMLNAQAI